MRKSLSFLIAALILTSFVSFARAESTCGSDTSADPVAAMGKDVWLNGFCKEFLPCRQVLETFSTCGAAESFLSRLGAKDGQTLTEDQVADALVSTTGTSTNVSVCIWKFDALQCKQYLGVSEGSRESSRESSSENVTQAGSSVDARKRAMNQNAALVARQRVRDMDANAHTAVGVIERACRAGAVECKDTLDSLITPLIRATGEINDNPEYLAHFPPFAPTSTEYAGRLGWTRNNEQWVFGNGQNTTTTLGLYLLTVEECRKLHDRLDKEIKSKPGQEPAELSFLEAECLQRMPEHQAAVAKWRQGFSNAAVQLASTSTSQLPLDAKTTGDLSQWDGGLRQAEQARKKAREDEDLRIAQQKKREAEERLSETGSSPSPSTRTVQKGGKQFESICDRNVAKLEDVMSNSGLRFYFSGYGIYLMNKLTVERESRCSDISSRLRKNLQDARRDIEIYERQCGGQVREELECRYRPEDEKFIALLTQESRKSIDDADYSSSYEITNRR